MTNPLLFSSIGFDHDNLTHIWNSTRELKQNIATSFECYLKRQEFLSLSYRGKSFSVFEPFQLVWHSNEEQHVRCYDVWCLMNRKENLKIVNKILPLITNVADSSDIQSARFAVCWDFVILFVNNFVSCVSPPLSSCLDWNSMDYESES